MGEGNPLDNLEAGTYTVVVSDANGCVLSDATTSFTVDFTTSTAAVQEDVQLSVFPNPAQQSIYIDTQGQAGLITIFAINGQQMWQQSTNSYNPIRIDLLRWPAGTYLIHWQTDGDSRQSPFVIQP